MSLAGPTIAALSLACAPQVAAETTLALVAAESDGNAFAIGVVGGQLERQPRHRAEAIATARALAADGWNFSLGLAQINRHNLERLGLTIESAFEPCPNLRAMQAVLLECLKRTAAPPQQALRQALSCYYSGNLVTGFEHGYVQRVVQRIRHDRITSGVPP